MSSLPPNLNGFVPDRALSNNGVNPAATGKRSRRQRSMNGSAHYGNGQKGKKGPGAPKEQYHDRKSAAPIFLQKTFEMINSCDPNLAGWTEDGTMFVIKEQTIFAQQIIPQFFDHNKFASFARQLNFYGFRKMQSKAIYKNEFNKDTAKHVTFYNEKFQRGRQDLLKDIQRSTKGGQNAANQQKQTDEINHLKDRVGLLERTIKDMQNEYNNRLAAIQSQLYQFVSYSNNGQPPPAPVAAPTAEPMTTNISANGPFPSNETYNRVGQQTYQASVAASIPEETQQQTENGPRRATLAPHPNSKVLPAPDINRLPQPPGPARHSSFMRGFSQSSIDLGYSEMSPFEQKFLESALDGPNPPEEDAPRLSNPRQARLTREMSEQIQNLDLNDTNFPTLSSV